MDKQENRFVHTQGNLLFIYRQGVKQLGYGVFLERTDL